MTWKVRHKPTSFRPPGTDVSYHWGLDDGARTSSSSWRTPWNGWNARHVTDDTLIKPRKVRPTYTAGHSSQADENGEHQLKIEFIGQPTPPSALSIEAEATVLDLNNQSLVSSESLMVHTSKVYVGLLVDKLHFQHEETVRVHCLATDVDGTPVKGAKIRLFAFGRYRSVLKRKPLKESHQAVVVTDDDGRAVWDLVPCNGGVHLRVTAATWDCDGRASASEVRITVSGGWEYHRSRWTAPDGDLDPITSNVSRDSLLVVPDKEQYAPGEMARVRISVPFTPCEGVLSVHCGPCVQQQRFSIPRPPVSLVLKKSRDHEDDDDDDDDDGNGTSKVGASKKRKKTKKSKKKTKKSLVGGGKTIDVDGRANTGDAPHRRRVVDGEQSALGRPAALGDGDEVREGAWAGTCYVHVRMEDYFIPNVSVRAVAVGACTRAGRVDLDGADAPSIASHRPWYAHGSSDVSISTAHHRLHVDVSPARMRVVPNEHLPVRVRVLDHHKHAVREAEVLLIAVDEAVLSLSGHALSNPLHTFFPSKQHESEPSSWYFDSRERVLLRNIPELVEQPQHVQPSLEDSTSDDDCRSSSSRGEWGIQASGGEDDGGVGRETLSLATDSFSKSAKKKGGIGLPLASLGGLSPSSSRAAPPPPGGRQKESRRRGRAPKNDRYASGAEHSRLAVPPEEYRSASAADASASQCVRTSSSALCAFLTLRTDADGVASFDVPIGGRLTSYRIWAVACTRTSAFGLADACVVASQPLMVRPSLPRFMNVGDVHANVAVTLQNQTSECLEEVRIAMRLCNAEVSSHASSSSDGGCGAIDDDDDDDDAMDPSSSSASKTHRLIGYRVRVAPCGRRLLRFGIRPLEPGEAVVHVVAVGVRGDARAPAVDAVEHRVRVYAPASTEAFATYGSVEQDGRAIVQPVARPHAVHAHVGGLAVHTCTTALQNLTDAATYLWTYQYQCSEQIASSLLAGAALKDVLGAFGRSVAGGGGGSMMKMMADEDALVEHFSHGIGVLRSRQQPVSGGFGLFRRLDWDYPFMTVHVAHALARCRNKGFLVPTRMMDAVERYLSAIKLHAVWPLYRSDARREINAYALYVRYLLGHDVRSKALAFYQSNKPSKRELARGGGDEGAGHLGRLSPCFLGWILAILAGDPGHADPERAVHQDGTEAKVYAAVQSIRKHLHTLAHASGDRYHFPVAATPRARQYLFHSRFRADGVILEALVDACPGQEMPLVEGLVKHLMLARRSHKHGHWGNTQDNAFVLLALDRYFHVMERDVPDLRASVWVGDVAVAQHEFKGRTLDHARTVVPMNELQRIFSSSSIRSEVFGRTGMLISPNDPRWDADSKPMSEDNEIGSNNKQAKRTMERKKAGEKEKKKKKKKKKKRMDKGNARKLMDVTAWDDDVQPILLQKIGVGRLYYRLSLDYAPEDLVMPMLSRGFEIHRTYEAVDDPTDVKLMSSHRDEAEDGEMDCERAHTQPRWLIKAGSRVRVRIAMNTTRSRYHVALVDKMPSGLEPLNSSLKGTTGVEHGESREHGQGETRWFDHENLRDERAEVFACHVPAGKHRYWYTCRATTPGTFIAPPAKAEEMYSPEVFGRCGTHVVEIVQGIEQS